MTNKSPSPVVLARNTPHKSAAAFRDLRHPHLINFQDEWLDYDGSAYGAIDDSAMEAEANKFLIEAMQKTVDDTGKTKLLPFNPKRTDLAELIAQLKHLCHKPQAAPPSWLDGRAEPNPRNVISFRNCLLDIETRKTYPHTSQFFTRSALPIDYDDLDLREPERWMKFVREVMNGNQCLIDLMQEMFGYLLSCDTSLQKVFFAYGPPRTGKGTTVRILQALIGPRNAVNPTIESLSRSFGLWPLAGALVAIVSDMNCHDRAKLAAAASHINAVSGEDTIQAERKFKDPYQVRLRTRFMILGNTLPDFGEHAPAVAARLLALPFLNSFQGREDFGLEAKLMAELPGILLWALEGLRRLRARGRFLEPESSKAVKSRMLHLSNPVRGYVDEHLEASVRGAVDKDEVYHSYVRYCEDRLRTRPLARERFAESLLATVPGSDASKAPRDKDGRRRPIFTGVQFNAETLEYVHRDLFKGAPAMEFAEG